MSAAPRERVPSLDGLRGVAIAMILAFHLFPQSGTSAVAKTMGSFCLALWSGVDLFFVLSGFLITGILLDHRESPELLPSFYSRRVLRIVPLYYVFLALVFVVAPTLIRATDFRGPFPNPTQLADLATHQGWFWAFLANVWMSKHGFIGNNLGMLWSLSIEEQFYLAWPIVVRLCPRRRLALVCIAIIALAAASRFHIAHGGHVFVSYYGTLSRLDALAAGALCAIGVRSESARPRLARVAPGVALALALALGGLAARVALNPFIPLVQMYVFPAFIVLFAATVLTATTKSESHPVNRTLTIRPLRFLGRYSYSMYLFHDPIHGAVLAYLVLPEAAKRWIAPAVTVLLTIGVALLTWRTIEEPALRLKRFLPYEGRPTPEPKPSTTTTR